MNALVEEIKSRLLTLIGQGIVILPAIAVAILIIIATSHGASFVRRITTTAVRRTLRRNRSLQSLLVQMSFVASWTVGIVIACIVAFPDLGLGDIIGLLGLSSVAIGFAFQDIFKNFLAGVLLLLQEPFKLNDQILVNGFEGTVEEIAIRSTQIRTYQGEIVVIPNAIVFTSAVTVMTALDSRRTDLNIGVDYNTHLPMAVKTLRDAIDGIEGVLSNSKPEIDVVSFGDSAIDLVVRYWTLPTKKEVRRTQTNVMIALKQACDRANINIPYPIRTVYHFDQEKFNDFDPVSANRASN